MKKLLQPVARFLGREMGGARARQVAPSADVLSSSPGEFASATAAGPGQVAPTPKAASDFARDSYHAQVPRSLIVEGWRFLAHSYAMVNQWQLLALSRRSDVSIKVVDTPLFGRRWQMQDGLFEPQAEQILKSLARASPDERADVTLRVSFPLDFSRSRSRLTAVFGTSENQVIRKDQLPDAKAFERLRKAPPPSDVKVVTPSHWSAEGFYKAGFRPQQVLIVPHGVDVATFYPMAELRNEIRTKFGVSESEFVFLSVGAMTGNKGIDLLLQAFAEVSRKFPQARLVLKGMDPLYKSKDLLLKSLQLVATPQREYVVKRLSYFGESYSNREMAQFYQVADVYVSPYRAEGFNIPVLEATASGIPVICTRGGATDDFVTDAFARRIDSKVRAMRFDDQQACRLEPNVEHLIALMTAAIEDDAWRGNAADAGPAHVRENYTWDRVVATLVQKLFD